MSVCVSPYPTPRRIISHSGHASLRDVRESRAGSKSVAFFLVATPTHPPTYALSLVELRAILTEPIPLTIVVFCFGFVPFVFFLATVQGCVRVVALFFSSSSSLWLFGARRHRCCLPREETPKPCGLSQWNVIATGPPAVYQSLFY